MVSSKENFFRGLLRISIIQILRSVGFTKTNNSIIDIITDLYIRHFGLLLTRSLSLAKVRDDDDNITIQDISQAVDDLKLIRPTNKLDVYDIHLDNYKFCEKLDDWVFGPIPARARIVAKPNATYIRNKKIESLKMKINNSSTNANVVTAPNDTTTFDSSFIKKDQDELELEKLTSTNFDPKIIKVPEDYVKYLISNTEKHKRLKIKSSVLDTELYSDSEAEDDSHSHSQDQLQLQAEAQKLQEEENIKHNNKNKTQFDDDFIVLGPTPEKLISYLPYTKNKETFEKFNIQKYINTNDNQFKKDIIELPSSAKHFNNEIELKDFDESYSNDGDGRGFQLGGW
ncbi:hypothetical protein PACTADRAFT_34146 [Pachysolen tannophilus NRRL Y-2460]|uniref:Bromodomain associated domain-containing protein n=1 Tax=Pachysolen tannophilus NRRL Y-2460 TaxID=669874 RepID=A0A1E4TUZ0_PACTA|nr:hypothetical protein PACTADRAFT_34146 [Pachysolen tannophilus NRRL Y-2460]